MEKTAVEWLAEQLPIYGYNVVTVYPELIEQAKEMEKQQIIDAYVECWKTHVPNGIEYKLPAKE